MLFGQDTRDKSSHCTRGHEPHNAIAIHVLVENSFITAMDELPEFGKGMMGICGYLGSTIHECISRYY